MQKRILICIALTSLMTAVANAQSSTNDFSRKGLWEVYGFGQAQTIFNVVESEAKVYGGGFGVGYNISQHFTLNADFAISSVDWEHGLFSSWREEESNATLFMGHISADWNILKYRVTPLVTVGLGLGAFSNGSGAALDQTVGVGVRWDASDHLFLKAIIRGGAMETTSNAEIDSGNAWATLGFSFALGYKF